MLIENACSEGTISPSDKQLLQKKAQEMGISAQELDNMIERQLHGSTAPANSESSGFVTADDPSLESSGFVTSDSASQESSGFVTAGDAASSGFVTSEPDLSPIQQPAAATKPAEPTFDDKLTDLQELSSQGAMSKVYKGKLYGKWIIIKRIKPEVKDNPQYRSLFMKEFENSYNLDHENIVKILDKGEDANGLYYTMEYVDGRALSDCIKNGELKNEKLIKSIIKQLCNALSYVHKKQIVHRDLKPDNIIITYRGDNVKILDFGIAFSDSFDDNLVKVGTPKYAAPEQMTKGNLVDQRADIYAVGLILLEMATGSLADRKAETVKNPNFKLVITKATKQDPEDRYHDCEELLEDLNKTIVIQAAPIAEPEPPKEPEPAKEPEPSAQAEPEAVKQPEPAKAPENNVELTPEPPKPQAPQESPAAKEKKKSSLLPIIIIVAIAAGVGIWLLMKGNAAKEPSSQPQKPTEQTEQPSQQTADQNQQSNAGPSEEERRQNMEDSKLKERMKEADDVFDTKNVARAKALYEKILADKPGYSEAKQKLSKCNDIINAANLDKATVGKENGKCGFVTPDGYVIVDYLYDEVVNAKVKGIQAVKKGKYYGIIGNDTKLPVTEFKYTRAIWKPDSYELVKEDGNRDHSDIIKYIDGKSVLTQR